MVEAMLTKAGIDVDGRLEDCFHVQYLMAVIVAAKTQNLLALRECIRV